MNEKSLCISFVASLMLPLCLCKHLAPSGVCTALPCAAGSKNKYPYV